MVARLARAPIAWREVGAVLTIAGLAGFFGLWGWARQPVGPPVRTSARIVKVTYVSPYKYTSAYGSIEVAFADGRHDFVSLRWERAFRCRPGETVDILLVPARIGKPDVEIDPEACG